MSPLNLSGLASGLDTETIITQLMSVEAQPKTRMQRQDAAAQSRQTQLRDVQTRLNFLRDTATDLRSTATWADTQKIASSDAARVSVRALGTVAPGAHQFEVSKLAVSAQHAFDYTASASAQSVQIGSFTLAVDPNSTVGTVAAAINARSDSPVSAVVAGGKLVLSSRASGAANDFTVTAPALLAEDVAHSRAGADAAYTIDGVAKTSSSNVLTDAVLGAEVTLRATTAAPVAVTISDPAVDTDAIKTKIQAFVTQYNSVVDFIRSKTTEAPVKNPTTTVDAAKGAFYGDSMLTSMLTSMRTQIGDLTDLGISTGAPSGAARFSDDAVAGHLTLDGTKLDAALAADPDAVQTRIQAFGQRILDVVAPPKGNAVATRLTSEDATRKRLADSMAAMDVRLADKEKGLRAKFTAMESALAAAQSAQAQMTAQLASLR
ncbi:MAG TPA: flagellar filament capping protein FliD [Solirubrobacteraceae bacterium]|nr:flagellar filament capping protein FliD [Solirubrobacteraceae bacterium]